jgi:FKBP-type peptidyl-prolyl cis-trans isomerase
MTHLISVLAASAVGFHAPMIADEVKIDELRTGKGNAVQPLDLVVVDYTGTLTSGKQFDSSRGKAPFSFRVGNGQVIKGWETGLVGMKQGGQRRLTIPPSLGYGAQDLGDIPPNSTLVFVIDLRKIQRADIKTTTSGKGKAAGLGDTVTLHYRGKLANGKQFDASYDRNQPFDVTLGQGRVIGGFEQGLWQIRPGEKRTVTIPQELGYGERGAGNVIPPKAKLIFEIEALKVS